MKPASGTRKPYTGTIRSLVLALDVGTTFSGVSYAILEPGEVPKIHGVTRFPGQEHVAGNSKIPSIMYYDADGIMKAAGAEAESASMVALAEDEGWFKTELFKLRLRPKAMKLKMNGMRLAPLPLGKTAVDVFGDFLSYLFHCTRSFIIDTHANGHALWRAVEHDIQFVLSHPNGWEGAQQAKMRRAAAYGGLIPDTDEGKARIRFVTEGEASLHACVLNGLAADVLSNPSGHGFIVADAGGGTLDISSYAIRGTSPLVIEEIAPPDCVFAGSVFVSRRARAFLEGKLKTSKYGTPDSLDHITKRFDETTKRLFRDSKELQFVPFGSPLDKDLSVGIRGGQLKLHGVEVATLFEPSIEAAVLSIKQQIDSSGGTVKSVWLVGGFAASPWLFLQLQERLSKYHVVVSRPDTQTSKAVADGAIGFYCDHHVSARVSKFMYGVEYLREFDPKDEEHVARKHRLFEMPSGPRLLPDAFDCILARGVKVKESNVFSRKYCTEVTNLSTLSVFEVEIWCFRGGDTIPKWIHRSSEVFSTLCYVRADLSPLAGSAQAKQGRGGKNYWTIVFSIEIHFGLTEFKARIKWVDNGRTRYGPASIVYNEGGTRAEEDEPDSSPEDNVTVLSSPSDRGPSRSVSQPPSRDPSMRSARPSVPASPHLPTRPPVEPPVTSRGFEVERQRTASTSSHGSRAAERTRTSSTSSRATREIYASSGGQTPRSGPPPPEPMQARDRSINISGVSAESGRSGSTRLGEQLNAIWGQNAPSVSSPLAENPPYNAHSSAHSRQPSRRETKPPTPKEPTPPAMSKQPTPPTMSSLQTPVMTPPPLGEEPPIPRPPSELSYATPVPSKPPSPPPVQAPVTPSRATSASSKIPTPASGSKAATPAWGSKAATPASGSKAGTPAWGSKAATPAWGSKIPTPATQSKAATPRAMSKAATPKAATPRAITPPPAEPEPEPEPAPLAPIEPEPEPQPESAWEPEPAPAEPVPQVVHAPPMPEPTSVSALFGDVAPIVHPGENGDEHGFVPPPFLGGDDMDMGMPGSMGGDGPQNPSAAMSPMADLWATPVPDTPAAQPTSAGLFSDFLSGPSWSNPASKLTSGFGFGSFGGGGGGGNSNRASGGGGGGFGGLGSFGWGGSNNDAAAEEENRKQEEAIELERVRIEAEEAERKRVEEEEAARKAAEEQQQQGRQQEEEAKKKPAKKMNKREQAQAKKAEEKERKAKEDAAARETEEAEAAQRAAEEAEEAARKAEEEAAEAARKAEQEASEAQQAVEEAAAPAATATTPAEAAVAAELAEDAQHAQAEAVEAAHEAQEAAAEAEKKEEAAEEAVEEAKEAGEAAEQAAEAAQAASAEEEWGFPVKTKKGKKSAMNTPDPLSRQTSEAPDGFATAGGKKKKGKKK